MVRQAVHATHRRTFASCGNMPHITHKKNRPLQGGGDEPNRADLPD